MQSLITAGKGIRLQRLAYDKPLTARELQKVYKVKGKSTFILTGRDGSQLVAKFEPGSEAQDQKRARLMATNLLAKQILPNVPSFQFLTASDLTALTQVPDR